MNEFVDTLADLDRGKHHFVMKSLISFLDHFIGGDIEYLKGGVKHGLWKEASRNREEEILNQDLKRLTKLTIGEFNIHNFTSCLYKIATFIIKEYEGHLRDEKLVMKGKKSQFRKLLKRKEKDSSLKIWLRFCFRLKGFAEPCHNQELSYIG